MLCQNCNKNEANMHMKRIINGHAAEVHLCSDCARSLGYGDAFSGVGLGFSDFFEDLFHKNELSASAVRCHGCNKSFEEIASDGEMGCAECYVTFFDKIQPLIHRLHGRATHIGKKPHSENSFSPDERLQQLKVALQSAVDNQDFELAVKLRDEINGLIAEGGAF